MHIFNTQKFVLSRKIHTFANVNHSEKLCGTVIMRYQPSENIIQVLVADDGIGSNKMETIFKFSNIGENLGTRMLGEKVRNELLPLIQNNDKVILDFSGVDVVSNSFADECLAKLLLSMTFEELKQKTTTRNSRHKNTWRISPFNYNNYLCYYYLFNGLQYFLQL